MARKPACSLAGRVGNPAERMLSSLSPSVHTHETTPELLDRFPWYLVLGGFMETCQTTSTFIYNVHV
jgi:hypothetical protein